jgi:hypothetical protein
MISVMSMASEDYRGIIAVDVFLVPEDSGALHFSPWENSGNCWPFNVIEELSKNVAH